MPRWPRRGELRRAAGEAADDVELEEDVGEGGGAVLIDVAGAGGGAGGDAADGVDEREDIGEVGGAVLVDVAGDAGHDSVDGAGRSCRAQDCRREQVHLTGLVATEAL